MAIFKKINTSEPLLITLRTPAMEKLYFDVTHKPDYVAGLTHIEPKVEFKFWYIIPNEYPYDLVFKTNDMLLPKRKVGLKSQLSRDELAEFEMIKDTYVNNNYDLMIENTARRRTIPDHYHIHLCVYKENKKRFTKFKRLW